MADRDIFEEMVRAGAVAMWGSTERDATKIARMVLSAALAGRQVVDLPEPLRFADEHNDVKTWEPDGVDFQVSAHPAEGDTPAGVSFAYWNLSASDARGVALAILAASFAAGSGSGEG